ncbi:hypothetical protein KFK09_012666 [Dendrobium nobile]|uniref:Pentatricopeptide repeat-containing protein-mitochondrial domain-containing protein n=1 Tax=Dendrobium nobile TaxID=94219 RepID=A0A8T3BJJ4_DENNO|nr:hypothetical protein KFK09_012666 [Dendrobium nobile]
MRLRSCKSARFPYKGKWQESFSELLAMETFKRKVAELQDRTTNVFSILLNCFQKYEINPTPSAYSFVIKYVSHRCLFSQIPAILDHLEQEKTLEVPEKIFLDLIQVYGKANKLQDAINIFYRIPKFRCTPSVHSLNSLLSLLCKKKESLLLVQDVLMKTPEMKIRFEASTFHILIRALCRNGKVGSALELLKTMQLEEYNPEAKIYSMVLSSLCRHGGVTEVLSFLEDMKTAGHLPTAMEYNSVIDVLVKEGKVNHAHSLLEELKSEGRRPHVLSYNSVLHGFCLANDFQNVEELFDEMLVMGLLPNIFTFNIYISSLSQQGKFERAYRMISCMDKIGCKPDTQTFNILLAGYTKAGEKEKIRGVKKEMVEKRIQWNSNTYSILIEGLLHNCETLEAYRLFKEMLGNGFVPQPSTCNALVCSLCEMGKHTEALRVLEVMSKPISPDAVVWEALLYQFMLDFRRKPFDFEGIIGDS